MKINIFSASLYSVLLLTPSLIGMQLAKTGSLRAAQASVLVKNTIGHNFARNINYEVQKPYLIDRIKINQLAIDLKRTGLMKDKYFCGDSYQEDVNKIGDLQKKLIVLNVDQKNDEVEANLVGDFWRSGFHGIASSFFLGVSYVHLGDDNLIVAVSSVIGTLALSHSLLFGCAAVKGYKDHAVLLTIKDILKKNFMPLTYYSADHYELPKLLTTKAKDIISSNSSTAHENKIANILAKKFDEDLQELENK